MIIIGIKIDIRCNKEYCPFSMLHGENFCTACKHFVPIDPPTLLDELYELKAKYEEQGKVIISVTVKDNNIIKIYTKLDLK